MTTAREVLQLIITGDGKGAVAEMKKVGAAAKTELGAAEKATVAMHTRMIAGGAAVAAGGAAVLFGLKQTTDAYLTAGRETMKLSRLTGGTTEEMSRLRFVATQTGVGVDSLATSVIRLSKSSQSKGGRSTLAELGIDIDNADGSARGAVGILTDLAGVFEGMPDGIEKNSLALKLFGRAGTDLIPLLNRGGEGIQALIDQADKLGLTMTDEDVAKIKEYTAAQRELAAARESVKMQIGREVFPALADGMENVANLVSSTAEAFSRLPAPVKSSAGGIVSYGSAALVAVGSVSLLSGVTQKMVGNLRGAEGGLNGAGKAAVGLGSVLAVLAATDITFAWLNEGAGRAREMTDAINQLKIAASSGTTGADPLAALGDLVAAEQNTLRIQNLWQEFGSEVSIVGTGVKADVEQVQRAFDALVGADPAAAGLALAELERVTGTLDKNSQQYATNTAFINRNRQSMALAAGAADTSADALLGSGNAAAQAAVSLDRAAYSYEKTGDAAEGAVPGAIGYAQAVRSAIDPVLAIADANDRLKDAQRAMAEAADPNAKEVRDAQRSVADSWRSVEDAVRGVADAERGVVDARRRVSDATRDLSDAQSELNELLNDDPMFGLKSVSPEDQIADARNRLAEANRRLLADPMDVSALTMRDDALADLEKATQRRQDIARDGDQRAKDIENARRRVEDAERSLGDANRGVGDAERALEDARRAVTDAQTAASEAQAALAEMQSQHGLNSEEYAAAARAVIEAALGVQDADADLAQYLRDNGITAVAELNRVLDDLAAKGGPVGEAAATMKGQLADLVGQAEAYGESLNIDEPVAGMQSAMEKWFGWTTGHPPAVAQVDANTKLADDKVSIWQWVASQAEAVVRVDADTSPAMARLGEFFRIAANPMMMILDTVGKIPAGRPSKGIDPNANGGVDGNYWTPYHSGGKITGAARGQEIPILGLGHEGVVNLPGMDFIGPDGLDAINARRIPTKFRTARIPGLSGAMGGSSSSVVTGGAVTISTPITMVTPEPRLSGVAVVDEIRQIGHRAGRGMAVDAALGRN